MSLESAIEALKRKDFPAALALVDRMDPATFDTRHFLIKGLSELALQDWQAGLETFTAASDRFSDYALFWLNRGLAEETLQKIDAAIASQKRCLELDPKLSEAYGNLSNLYRKQKRFAEAEAMAREALAKGADKGDALNCLGIALSKQGKFDEARAVFEQAPPNHALVLANRANLATELFQFEEAWKFFAQARAIDDKPVIRHDEGLARLLAGDYARGFELFESRLAMPNALRLALPFPIWKGESLAGKKLLIIAEQGFGDVIQFARYGKYIADGELFWAVPKNLIRLLAGQVRGMIVDEAGPLPICDYYAPVVSLPTLTGHAHLEPCGEFIGARDVPELPKGNHKRKIGLVWAGSRTHDRDHERSMPLEALAPLLTMDADFYAPFIGDALKDIGPRPITRIDYLMTDFADTAALMKQMDCIITVDTVTAHLAGSLGIPTFLLLSYCPDWRWGVTGDKTEWYPTLTLIRQPKYGDWKSVVEKLKSLLERRFGEAA